MSLDKPAKEIPVSLNAAGTIPVGQIIDERYKVLSLIGVGGFGSVYKVQQILLQNVFALKTLNPVAMSEITMMRLQKEAKAASRLDHPNLVKAVDFGFKDNVQPFMVMEYIEGLTLAQYLKKESSLGVEKALQLFIPLCFGMSYAHEQGVIHRDLKPSNIILSPDDQSASGFVPKILDFGIAKTQFGDDAEGVALTKTGEIFGTPLYMSPEQCNGLSVDGRADIYSMGCVLFEALTGTPPFPGSSSLETMMQHQSSTAPSLREGSLGQRFPEPLENVIAKMLAKKPEHRFQTFDELVEELIRLQRGDNQRLQTMAPPISETQRGTTTKRFHVIVALLAGIAIGVAGMALCSGIGLLRNPTLGRTDDNALKTDLHKDDYRTFIDNSVKFSEFFWTMARKNLKENEAVPEGAKVILIVDPGLITSKEASIKPGKYAGVSLEKFVSFYKFSTSTPAKEVIRSQPQLQYLSIEGCPGASTNISRNAFNLDRPVFDMIATLADLRGLSMLNAAVDGRRVDGDIIAAMPSLAKLRFLHLYVTNSASPVLNQLAHGPIRWLSLSAGNGLTRSDLQQIATMKRLEVLSFHRVVNTLDPPPNIPAEATAFNELAELPNLRELSLDSYVATQAIPALRRCKKLTTLFVRKFHKEYAATSEDDGKDGPKSVKSPFHVAIEKGLPGVKIQYISCNGLGVTNPAKADTAEYLDLQKVSPESAGLW
jgi:serine/threonine protein kinase